MQRIFRHLLLLVLVMALGGQLGGVLASDNSRADKTTAPANKPTLPNPAAMTFRLPKDLKFDPNQTKGTQKIVLYGDPDKPGNPYEILQKWFPNSMTQPHFHTTDRYIYVVSGTWWVGSGPKFDPNSTYPTPAGSFVHQFANELHYDGAKGEPCVLIITGVGPASLISPAKLHAEKK